MIRVSYYPFGSSDLAHEDWDDIASAVEFARSLLVGGNNRGTSPAILYSVDTVRFRASPCLNRRGAREWAMSFPTLDAFRSRACSIAEMCGVRYPSHRKGYRASERAFAKFLTAVA